MQFSKIILFNLILCFRVLLDFYLGLIFGDAEYYTRGFDLRSEISELNKVEEKKKGLQREKKSKTQESARSYHYHIPTITVIKYKKEKKQIPGLCHVLIWEE